MGQTPTKFSHQYGFDPLGTHNLVVPPDCKKRDAGAAFQPDSFGLETHHLPEHNSPHSAGTRITQKKKRRQQHQEEKGKANSPDSRKGHLRHTSNTSTISAVTRSTTDSSPFSSPSPATTTAESALSVPRSVTIPIEEQALCFFVANWILVPRQGSTGGYMEYIIPLYSSCKPNSHLHYALSAASLAAFGNRPCARRFSPESVSAKASLMYAKALEYTNRALRDPSLAKEDATLAAVLMLGTFESITTHASVNAWGSHNEGAIALVKLRGPDNLKTRAGRILFAAVRTQTLIRCATLSQRYDKSIDWGAPHTFRDDGASGTVSLNMLLIDLRTDCDRILTIHSRVNDPSNRSKVLGLLARAKAAKQAYITWANARGRAELWNFGPAAFIEKLPQGINLLESEVFPGRVDVYNEMWIAGIWNMGRTAGLLYSSIVVRCAAWLSPQTDFRLLPEFVEASRFDRKIVKDMIASVPFLLGWHKRQSRKDFLVPPEDQGRTPSYSRHGFACGDDGPAAAGNAEQGKALGGYFSMWPMFVAASSDFCTDAESQWIHGRLRFISDHMGVHQANFFASAKVKLPSMLIQRDQMELANMAPPPSNFLEKAIIEGQHLPGQESDKGIRKHEFTVDASFTDSPATSSAASPENFYRRDSVVPVATQ